MCSRPRSATPARVSLILPALIWPGGGLTAALQQLELPALRSLLGLGQIQREPAQPWSHWLPRQFGADALAWASLRWAGELPQRPARQNLLCADPVSLNFASDALLLRGPRELGLTPEECQALIEALNTEFGDLGEWFAASTERWYLASSEPLEVSFHPLAEVLGRPIAYFPAEGPQARQWNRIANEIQVMLHNHPLNQARSARGQLMANALWFWGESPAQASALKSPCSHLLSSEAQVRGLALAAGCALADSPAQVCAGLPGHCWWLDSRLQDALQAGDFNAWLAGLLALEGEVFQPLLAAWKNRRLHRLQIIAPADKLLFSLQLSARSRWALWRKPLTPGALAACLQTPAPHTPT